VLTDADETLLHQLPTTFDHVGTSDPRFYDRFFFCAHDPDGRVALHLGIARYCNMNVMDGYVSAVVPRASTSGESAAGPCEQHNLRVTRALRPEIDALAVGPIQVEVLEPYRRARFRCASTATSAGGALAVDLEWRAGAPPKEEEHHFRRLRGRVTTDYHRYTIVGTMHGTVEVAGVELTADGWFGARDHSWGVREQVAGPEPVTGPPGFGMEAVGFVFSWLPFRCGDTRGHVQLQMLGDGTVVYCDGVLHRGDRTEAITAIELDAQFHPGTRAFSRSVATCRTAGGDTVEIVSEPLTRPFSMDGTGYDWGWDDGQGLGVYRGEAYAETDVYDLADPELVVRPDGSARRPMHRETPVRVTVDGVAGLGHHVFVLSGPITVFGPDLAPPDR
jgi:hypothetical protein